MTFRSDVISLPEFRAYATGFADRPKRTTALEDRIEIGTGFHGKWYRSQREHMLGWLLVQECRERKNGNDPRKVSAKGMWGRLKCSPLMFWVAEEAKVPDSLLDDAEAAAVAASQVTPTDGDPHGAMLRVPLPWRVISTALRDNAHPVTLEQADAAAIPAFERLVAKNASYRDLRNFLVTSTWAMPSQEASL